MSIFKKQISYKDLYETEKNNRKMYEQRYREIEKQYQDLQKNKGIGKMRNDLMKAKDVIYDLKVQVAQLKLDIEDLRGFYEQEKAAKEYLKRERDNNGKQEE